MKGVNTATLSWNGAGTTSVDVYRDGVRVITTANDGSHVDSIARKGGGSYSYRVCEQGTTVCSNTATVSF